MNVLSSEKGIFNFGVYKEIFPIITNTIQLLEENKNNFQNYNFLYQSTIDSLLGILSNLSKGYNKYHSQDKAQLYSLSRDNLSISQSNLLLIAELKIISKDKILTTYNQLEEKIKYLNGLIRKMETNPPTKKKDVNV